MVRMWPYSFLLMWSIIAARVVDLPEPVGPVTRTRPRHVDQIPKHRRAAPVPPNS